MSPKSPFLVLELRIASTSKDDIVRRWRSGRKLLIDKAGRKQLPKGKIDALIKEAADAGVKVSEREIQRRIKCAEVYTSEAQVRRAGDGLGSWTALHEAGFPLAEVDTWTLDLDELEAEGIPTGAPDEWEQLTLIPGAPPEIKIRGRQPVPVGEATVALFGAYCEQSAQMTTNFAKRDALLHEAYRVMRIGAAGDDSANAVEAWQRGSAT